MDTSQYLSLFLEESKENIENLNQSMLELEKDPGNVEIIGEIFRYAHTLKGMSATMGYNSISELTHSMENVLDKLRNKELHVSTELVTILFECVDILEKMIDSISENNSENIDTDEIVKKLNCVEDNEVSADTPSVAQDMEYNKYDFNILREARERLYNAYKIFIVLRKDCQLKSARAFLIFNNLEEYGEIVKSHPLAEDLEKEDFEENITIIYLTLREKSFVNNIIENISEIESYSVDEVEMNEIKDEAVSEVSVKHNIKDDKLSSENNTSGKKLGQTVRVDIDRLDKFMNLVGELVIQRTRLEEISSSNHITELNETLEQVGRISSDLQDLVMKVRMIPLERIFGRLPRMVRDLSNELSKEINFVMKGQETELDRTVIDELGESIIHLLRNAVDHGIEKREERIKAGKNPIGNVTVSAYQEGNKAVIKIEDDGKGLDLEKIKTKAAAKGINTDGMSDEDITNIIFLEGFSTSDKVTDVSGRGVGMDVVRTKLTSVGSTIDIKSEAGKGTTFTVYLPLTLSIIQALLVKISRETFAISLGFIEKVITISKNDIKYSNNREVIVYRDEIIRVVRLSNKLNLKDEYEDDQCFAVIARVGDKKIGLLVDSLIGQQEIVIKPLGESLKNMKEYVGATILGDGHVTLILDVISIIAER